MTALLWLHGVGDCGDGWAGNFRAVEREVPGLKCVHPDAPKQAVTSADGQKMASWFDIVSWVPGSRAIGVVDEPEPPAGLEAAVASVHKQLKAIEDSGVPAGKIVIGGFSQGGALAITAGLTYSSPIGGIVSISGWSNYRDTLQSKVPATNAAVPCMFCCGNKDDVIDLGLSRKSKEVIQGVIGDNLTYMEANRSGHFQGGSEMQAVEKFIVGCLK